MPMDAGSVMKARPRADLRAALKAASRTEVRTIRALITAIDNAEAPPVPASETAKVQHRFRSESAEVERLLLSSSQVRDVLSAEIHERERMAADMDRLNDGERAKALRDEALLAKRYICTD